jgi:hypothetical protein
MLVKNCLIGEEALIFRRGPFASLNLIRILRGRGRETCFMFAGTLLAKSLADPLNIAKGAWKPRGDRSHDLVDSLDKPVYISRAFQFSLSITHRFS